MDFIENVNTFVTGVFPDTVADNSSGVGTTDGFEFIAEWINNSVIGNQQDWMDYASLTPNGVTESTGFSQLREAMQLGHGIGPGKGVMWFLGDDPSVTGDRVLLLEGQGVLIASYPQLDAKCYVGDGANAAVAAGGGSGLSRGGFYHASDAAGTVPDTAGPYLILPDSVGYALRVLDSGAAVDPQGALRFLGDNQADAMQRITGTLFGPNAVDRSGWDKTLNGASNLFTASGSDQDYVNNGTSPGGTQNIDFDSTNSTSPNPAKTDDIETRTANISFKLGITY